MIVATVFGYAVFQALKLDSKLESSKDYFQTNTILKTLPDVSFPSFSDGKTIELKKIQQTDKLIIVHFWATWCGPCEEEFPALLELTKTVSDKSDVVFLFIAVNDKRKDIIKFLKKYDALKSEDFNLLLDDELKHQKFFGTYKLPETYLFNRDGSLLRRFSGAQNWMDPEFLEYFKSLSRP